MLEDEKEAEENISETILGINERLEGALCYVLWFITGLIFLVIEKNKFVRFHAIQSIATFIPLYMIAAAVEKVLMSPTISFTISILGTIIYIAILTVIWTLIAVVWVILIYKASKGEKYKVPIIGKIADKYS